jgi:hypothetical protein
MKNILAENLLRFGVKNLTESQKHALQLLTEDALANITDGCAVVGATKSNTTNAAAVAAFIKAGYTVNGTISSTTCIKKAAGATAKVYAVGPKTVNEAHYLKIGEKVISGTAPSSMIITFADLVGQSIEASGNGIFALGRAVTANSEKKRFGLTLTSGLSITLNTTKVIASFFNVKTGFQDAANDFGSDVIRTMIASAALQPTATNEESLVKPGMERRSKGISEISRIFGYSARPSIADITTEEDSVFQNMDPIDISTFQYNGKRINNTDAAKPAVESFCRIYFSLWISRFVSKFKKYIAMRCEAAGVPLDALTSLNALINSYSKTQNISTYTKEATDKLFILYSNTTSRSGAVSGAVSTSTSITGKEGEIAPTKQ